MNFKDKKVLITGATGGIGNSILQKFSSLDATILATGTNEDKLNNLNKDFPKIHISKFDISKHSNIEEFIDRYYSRQSFITNERCRMAKSYRYQLIINFLFMQKYNKKNVKK